MRNHSISTQALQVVFALAVGILFLALVHLCVKAYTDGPEAQGRIGIVERVVAEEGRKSPYSKLFSRKAEMSEGGYFAVADKENPNKGAAIYIEHGRPTIQLRNSLQGPSTFAVFLWKDEIIMQLRKGDDVRQIDLWELTKDFETKNIKTREIIK